MHIREGVQIRFQLTIFSLVQNKKKFRLSELDLNFNAVEFSVRMVIIVDCSITSTGGLVSPAIFGSLTLSRISVKMTFKSFTLRSFFKNFWSFSFKIAPIFVTKADFLSVRQWIGLIMKSLVLLWFFNERRFV